MDWENADEDFMEFCAQLVAFRREHPVFTRRRFFEGEPIIGSKSKLSDIGWFRPDGVEMEDEDWETGFARSLGVFLNGLALPDPDQRGHRLTDDSFLLLFNGDHGDVSFVLPGGDSGQRWIVRIRRHGPPGCRRGAGRPGPRSSSPPAACRC